VREGRKRKRKGDRTTTEGTKKVKSGGLGKKGAEHRRERERERERERDMRNETIRP